MRKTKGTLLAAALAAALAFAQQEASAQFSGFYLFGDSLTDAGSFKPVLPLGTGKFTTNPGPVWSEVLAQRYGFSAIPANQGATNYAEGGARVTQLPGVPDTPPTGTATPVAQQVQHFLAKGSVDSNALYSVWAGGNDLFFHRNDVQGAGYDALREGDQVAYDLGTDSRRGTPKADNVRSA